MASVGRVYISTDDLDRLRAARALCLGPRSHSRPCSRLRGRARQPLREQLKSCAACTMPAERCSVDPHSTRHHSPAHSPHSAPSTECGEQASGRCRSKLGSTEHDASSCRFALAKPAPSTETIRSASTVDEAVARTCVGDAYGTQTAVSAISRGREGRLGAAGGGRSTDDADAAECFSTICNAFKQVTARMSREVCRETRLSTELSIAFALQPSPSGTRQTITKGTRTLNGRSILILPYTPSV